MLPLLVLPLLAPSSADAVRVSAYLDASELSVGSKYEIIVELEMADGVKSSNARIAPMLQIDVPEGVELEGRVVETYEELAGNEFLNEPFERMLGEFPAHVGFQLTEAPEKGRTIGLNVIGYFVDASGQHSFLRQRLELPLVAGAEAKTGEEASTWGRNDTLLQIGQKASEFELPREDGSPVALSDYVGDKNIIVTTYRAFW